MTASAPRLILVLALAALATPALGETARRPAKPPPAPASDRGHARPLSAEELSASAGGAGPAEASADAPAQRLAIARKAITQLLKTKPG